MNSAGEIAAAPSTTVVHKIHTSQVRPNTVAARAKSEAAMSVSLRRSAHQCVLPWVRPMRISISLAAASTRKVTTNRRKASAISDER